MKNSRRPALFAVVLSVFFLLSAGTGFGTDEPASPLLRFLRQIPGAQITVQPPTLFYREAYQIRLLQPLDHHQTKKDSFYQKIYLSHLDFNRPTVIVTAGYQVNRNNISEPAKLLRANQILVEHRFCGDSRPDSLNWQYLTAEQAAADLHRVVQLFRRVYSHGWLSTGRSKGGQTAAIFRFFYPQDVDATVAYVAPFNRSQEDPRIDAFIRNRGGKECQKRIARFQLALLNRRLEIFPWYLRYLNRIKPPYLRNDETYEYAILEYPFTFWQWKKLPCDSIPLPDVPAEKLFHHLVKVIPFNGYFSRQEVIATQPAYYQFFTELGYYGFAYNDSTVLQNLRATRNPTYRVFAPPNVSLTFHPELMSRVIPWLQEHGDRMIYIYGGQDPWGATAIELTGKANAYKFVKQEGNHRTRIEDLSQEEQHRILELLRQWLNLPPEVH